MLRFVTYLALLSAGLTLGCAPPYVPPAPSPITATATPSATTTPTAAATATIAAPTDTPSATATLQPSVTPTTGLPGDPARGAQLFDSQPCHSCHDVTHPYPGGVVAPNLGNIVSEAARIVSSPEYHGHAADAAGYIRESIVDPNAYIVPGPTYHNPDGTSDMETDFAQKLTPQQIDDLVAYLMTLK